MAADTTKIQFYLSNDALAIVEASAAGAKSKGDWVSKAIVEYAGIMGLVGADEEACGTLEEISGRLALIEKRLALLYTKVAELKQPAK